MKNDLRGMPATGADAFALSRYEAALGQFQTYVGDPVATIDEAVQAAPAFVAGHLFKALVLYTLAERKFVPMAAEALDLARRHASRANERELGLMAAAGLLVEGRWVDACQALDRVLVDSPARRARAAGRAPDGLLSRRRAEPAQPRFARVAALGRVGTRLLVRARHARVRARGDEPVRRGRSDRAARAVHAAERRVGGARGGARDGDAGAHRRRHRVPAVARRRLGTRQRVRVPQLLAPRACSTSIAPTSSGARALRSPHPSGAGRVRAVAARRDGAALAPAPRRRGRRRPVRARRRRLGSAARQRTRLLRVQRRARDDGLRRDRPRHGALATRPADARRVRRRGRQCRDDARRRASRWRRASRRSPPAGSPTRSRRSNPCATTRIASAAAMPSAT